MKRRMVTSFIVFGMLGLVQAPAPVASSGSVPNIVFIITDDQRMDMFGFMPTVQSEIVARGESFDNAYAGNPLCCPARTSILRGQYSHYTRMYGIAGTYGGALKFRQWGLDRESLPVWLDRAGYRTALVGKYLNKYASIPELSYPTPPGWDYFRAWLVDGDGGYQNFSVAEGTQGSLPTKRTFSGSDPANYSTNVYTDYAQEFIASVPTTEPLFLSLNYHAPHAPYVPDPADATAPCGSYPLTPNFGEADVSDKPQYVQKKPWSSKLTSQMKQRWVKSCQMLLSVDRGIADVLGSLQTHDPGLDNTLIIYTSDQGIAMGEHRLTGKKTAYEESAGVPFFVRWDGVAPAGVASPRLVTHVDMTATAVTAGGAVVPNPIPCSSPCILGPMEGVNLAPLLTDPLTPWRDALLIEHYDQPTVPAYIPPYCAVVTDGRMKYVRYDPDDEPLNQELYDLNSDPYELVNRANDPAYSATRSALDARLQQLCSPTPVNYGF